MRRFHGMRTLAMLFFPLIAVEWYGRPPQMRNFFRSFLLIPSLWQEQVTKRTRALQKVFS